MSLEQRVARLEAENRRWKVIAVLTLIGGLAFLALPPDVLQPTLSAQVVSEYTLTAQRLVLKDKGGKEVFVIDANCPGCDGAFILKDQTGRHRLSFGLVTATGLTYFNIWDKDGKWIKGLGEEQMK